MLQPLSQTEKAFRDTLLTKATGEGFDRLARLYGFPRVHVFPERYWRRALRAIALGPRGTLGTTHAVLEALFDWWAEPSMTYPVILDPAAPQKLAVDLAETGPPGFYCNHVGRLIRITSPTFGSSIYWSTALAGADLTLAAVATSYWRKADWSTLGAPEKATAKILPFVYEEPTPGPIAGEDGAPTGTFGGEACLFRILLDGDIWTVPPTYVQTDGTIDRTVTAPGQPYGGHVIDYLDADPNTPNVGNQETGPFPPYLPGEDVGGILTSIIDLLLAAGVRVEFRLHAFCSDGNGFNIFQYTINQGLPFGWDWSVPIPVP